MDRFKQSFSLIPTERDVVSVLDATRVADMVIFLLSAQQDVDEFGKTLMTVIKSQGVPNVICMVQHLESASPKKQIDIRKSLLYYMSHHFVGDHKLFSISDPNDCVNCIRLLSSQFPNGIHWRDRSPYLIAQNWSFEANQDGSDLGTLKVTGYTRGSKFSANRLVHIPEFGDFQIESIWSAPLARHSNSAMAELLHKAVPELQENLDDQNIPDPMDAEQTWPTEEELNEAQSLVNQQRVERKTKRVPKGTSSYQAAWILEDDEDGVEVRSDDEDVEMKPDFEEDEEVNEEDEEDKEEYEEVELDNRSVKFDVLDDEENAKQFVIIYNIRFKEYLEKQRQAREELQFPDEVDTPQFMPASQRFAQYRGLKSFRSSPWDPYENLPIDYARIFQFQNFKRSKKRALDAMLEGIDSGLRVTIEIKNVPQRVQGKRYNLIRSHQSRPVILCIWVITSRAQNFCNEFYRN